MKPLEFSIYFAAFDRFLLHESEKRLNNSPPKFRVAWFRIYSGLLVCPVLRIHGALIDRSYQRRFLGTSSF